MNQLNEPLYLIGLPILLIWMLRRPWELMVMIELVVLTRYEFIDEDANEVTVVFEVSTKSFGR